MEKKFGDSVAIVFRHQPLPFHEHAMDAALAMQAAHRQQKAWAMHDKMFENNKALARSDLESYAAQLGLDVAKFKRDMDDPKTKEEVLADQKLAGEVGASGTPTFFINGRVQVGAKPFEELEPIIAAEIKRADELLAKGTAPSDLYRELCK